MQPLPLNCNRLLSKRSFVVRLITIVIAIIIKIINIVIVIVSFLGLTINFNVLAIVPLVYSLYALFFYSNCL